MALSEVQLHEIKIAGSQFLNSRRPPVNLRNQVDLNYRIEKQSVVVFEMHEFFEKRGTMIESSIAKATFTASNGEWKVYWMRGNLKWARYHPVGTVYSVKEFFDLVDEDRFYCFFG